MQDQTKNPENASQSDLSNGTRAYILKSEINVGKSNIVRRILGKDFQAQEATIGVEFGDLEVKNIDESNPNISLKLQLWDTSGAERYRAITTSHIRNADGALVVYDITNENSFKALKFWIDSITQATSSDVVIYLFGNKADMKEESNSCVDIKKVEEFARKNRVRLVTECSAKNNTNISDTFVKFYKDVYNQQKESLEQKIKEKMKYLSMKKKETQSKGCCS